MVSFTWASGAAWDAGSVAGAGAKRVAISLRSRKFIRADPKIPPPKKPGNFHQLVAKIFGEN
jgi:hypothetical protein